jgi:hypothetical protein
MLRNVIKAEALYLDDVEKRLVVTRSGIEELIQCGRKDVFERSPKNVVK